MGFKQILELELSQAQSVDVDADILVEDIDPMIYTQLFQVRLVVQDATTKSN